MKKSLLALAVLASASSVNAYEVFNDNGSTLDINGRAFAVFTSESFTETDSATEIQDGGSRLGFTATHQATENVKAIGRFEVEFGGDGVAFAPRDFYTGLEFADIGTLSFGRQTTAFDDMAFRGGFDEWYGRSQDLEDRGRDDGIVKFATSDLAENLVLGVTYQFAADNNQQRSGFTLAGSYDFDFGLGLAAGYYDYTDDNAGVDKDLSGMNLGVSYAFGAAKVGADFASDSEDSQEDSSFRLGGEYNFTDVRVYGGYGMKSADDNGADDSGYYIGAGYALGSKTTLFAEYSGLSYGNTPVAGAFESGFAMGAVVNF